MLGLFNVFSTSPNPPSAARPSTLLQNAEATIFWAILSAFINHYFLFIAPFIPCSIIVRVPHDILTNSLCLALVYASEKLPRSITRYSRLILVMLALSAWDHPPPVPTPKPDPAKTGKLAQQPVENIVRHAKTNTQHTPVKECSGNSCDEITWLGSGIAVSLFGPMDNGCWKVQILTSGHDPAFGYVDQKFLDII